MKEYHVACGIAAIYAGISDKEGDMWLDKSDVTDEALMAVAQYCLEHNIAMKFTYQGKRYRLEVRVMAESEEV